MMSIVTTITSITLGGAVGLVTSFQFQQQQQTQLQLRRRFLPTFLSLRYLSSSSSPSPSSLFMDDHFLLQQALQRAEQVDQQEQLSKSWTSSLKSLPFACTACGKCCRTKGSVFLSPTEIQATATFLNMTGEDFVQTYASHILPVTTTAVVAAAQLPTTTTATPFTESSSPSSTNNPEISSSSSSSADFVSTDEPTTSSSLSSSSSSSPILPLLSLADSWMVLKNHPDHEACIFLDDDSNTCSIYPVRPSQCSTYPFWPAVLQSQATWNDEVRRPEPSSLSSSSSSSLVEQRSVSKDCLAERVIPNHPPPPHELPVWTPDLGGCEGMKWISTTPTLLVSNEHDDDEHDENDDSVVSIEEAYRLLNIYQREERDMPRNPPIPIERILFEDDNDIDDDKQ